MFEKLWIGYEFDVRAYLSGGHVLGDVLTLDGAGEDAPCFGFVFVPGVGGEGYSEVGEDVDPVFGCLIHRGVSSEP